jgi:predicted Zn-dependent protease
VVLNNLAFGIAEHEGDLDQALTLAQKAKQLMPNQPEVSDTIGWIYLKKKLPDNAISIFQELVAKQPNQPTFQLHLGQAYAQKGDRTKAQSALRKALELNPSPEEKRQIQQAMAGGA